ncbi:MAG: transcriptional regulator [Chloroflexi bacterium]|nr:MAG: transcriptional regulator [Chloroflexota bacterium]
MRSDVARADYRRARRRAFMRGVLSWFRRADNALLAFDEVRRGIHAQAQRDGGLREVEIDQIVGSVGRYRDFDRAFLPRQVQTQDRWESVDRAYLDHTELPPVDLYKIGETYFVKDGNHRVSVARERGQSFIDAHVIEVTAPAPVDSVKDLLDFIRDQDALSFYEKTRISEMRPDARIELTLPGQYEKLLEHIATHQWYLGIEEKREVSYRDAVASWYDRIYLPTVEAIRATGALRDFPHRSEADLYLWITEHHWYLHQAALPKGTELKELISEYADEHSERRPNPLSVIGRIPPVTAVRRRVSPRREESP